MSNELIQALMDIEKERGIPKEDLIDAIKSALNTAYKKNFGLAQNVIVEFNEVTGDVKVLSQKTGKNLLFSLSLRIISRLSSCLPQRVTWCAFLLKSIA